MEAGVHTKILLDNMRRHSLTCDLMGVVDCHGRGRAAGGKGIGRINGDFDARCVAAHFRRNPNCVVNASPVFSEGRQLLLLTIDQSGPRPASEMDG
jgi:hypothetical protein